MHGIGKRRASKKGPNGSVSGFFLADPILDKAFEILRGQVLIPIQYSRGATRLEMATGKSGGLQAIGLGGRHRLP